MDSTNKTILGKDVLETLTLGMYDDARFIYREYIQNSADQIDKARIIGLVEEGEIHITIDSENGIICIQDDATGILSSEVSSLLKNVAQSTKTRGVDKGFRGIGRLGGLGYCDKLVFETSYKGENVKSILTWDAVKLKEIINDRNNKDEAYQVIDAVTSLKTEKEQSSEHYFRVTLYGIRNSALLNVIEIRNYLSMVAPVPFNSSFLYSRKIYSELEKEGLQLDEYKIYINTDPLYKGYTSYIYDGSDNKSKKKIGEITDIFFFIENDPNNIPLYWGWYGINEKNQSLNQINYQRGFRLRKSNIQIGNEDTLAKFHREKRFQYYFFAEIHALHPDLIPNARRDLFSENSTFNLFEDKIKTFFHTTIHNLCRISADINSALKTITNYNESLKEFEKKRVEGFVDKKERKTFIELIEKKKEEAEKAQNKIDFIQTKSADKLPPVKRILEKATSRIQIDSIESKLEEEKPLFRTDKLSKLNKEERKFLARVFTIIRNTLPNDMADLLINKIEEEHK
jgi:molecular chaperone HtpG